MAKLSGELKYALSCEPPGSAVARLNDSLCDGSTGRFVTLLVVVLDRQTRTLTLINAGHPAPLRRRSDGGVEVVGEAARGPALGLMPGRRYQEAQAVVEPGDVWVAYTDGFTEAISARGEVFGAARLRERLARGPALVRESGEQIVREVLTFLGDQPQSDDMCLVGWGQLVGSARPAPEVRARRDEPTQVPRPTR
jgi:serine phosphatase RsbU (regulator of sigma subunit)